METEKYRTGLKRVWAAIVDGIVFLPLVLVEQRIYSTSNNIAVLFGWAVFAAFLPSVYSVILHHRTGQTIGKWVAGVAVVDLSEAKKLTLGQSIFRDSFYLLIVVTGTVYYSLQLLGGTDQGAVLSDYTVFTTNPIFWWTILELVTMLTNSKRRAVHDFIAKSVVVRVEPSR